MPSYEDILSRVLQSLQPHVVNAVELTEETDLVTDLGLDSLKVMRLLEDVEDTFDIAVPLNILPDVHTVKDFAVQLHRLTREGQ